MLKKSLPVLMILFLIIRVEAQTVIASQNFSGGLGSWTSKDVNNSGTKWIRKTGVIASATYGNFYFKSPTVTNGYAIALADDAGSLNTELISPAIDCSLYGNVGITFNQWLLLRYTNTIGTVSVSTDLNTWSEVYNIQDNYTGYNPELIELDISSYAAYQSTVYIKYTYSNSLSEIFWAIDDIKVLALPEYDVAVKSVNTPKYTGLLNQTITATIQNRGGKAINGLTLGYEVNGNLVTENFNNLGILPFMTQDFTFASKFPITQVDVYNLRVISYGLSTGVDNNFANDTGKSTIISLSHLPEKNVLLEEFTTAPCGWCPGGTTRIDRIMETEGGYTIPVGMHAGFGTDAMTIPEHSTLSGAFGSGAPSAAIDRIFYPQQDDINVGIPSLTSTYNPWKNYVVSRKDYLQPVSIVASNTFTASNRELRVNVNATFHGVVKGDFRINCYIVEDSVKGTGSGYDQVSYYAGSPTDTSLNPWYRKGNPIVGFAHRNVVRKFLGGAWGNSAVIPGTTADGGTYSQDYVFTIPSNWNVARIKLVPFISTYSSDFKSSKNEVLNAAQMPLNGQVSINAPEAVYVSGIDESNTTQSLNIFPNPANNSITLSYKLENEARLSYEIYNVMGQMVNNISEASLPKGTINTTFNTENLESGIYLINIKEKGVVVRSSKFIIER